MNPQAAELDGESALRVKALAEIFPSLDSALLQDVLIANGWSLDKSIDFLTSAGSLPPQQNASAEPDSNHFGMAMADDDGIMEAWGDISASLTGLSMAAPAPASQPPNDAPTDIPLEYMSNFDDDDEQAAPELPAQYYTNSSISDSSPTLLQSTATEVNLLGFDSEMDLLAAMRAKTSAITSIFHQEKHREQQEQLEKQRAAEEAAKAARAAKAAKKWPVIRENSRLLGNFSQLPSDVAIRIFHELSAMDLCAMSRLNKLANQYFCSGKWWRSLTFRRFGSWDGRGWWFGKTSDLNGLGWKKIYVKLHTLRRTGMVLSVGPFATMWTVRGNELRRTPHGHVVFTPSESGSRTGSVRRIMPAPFINCTWDGKTLTTSGYFGIIRIVWDAGASKMTANITGSPPITVQISEVDENVSVTANQQQITQATPETVAAAKAAAAAASNGLAPRLITSDEVSGITLSADNSGQTWKLKTRIAKKLSVAGVNTWRITGDVPIPFIMFAVFELEKL